MGKKTKQKVDLNVQSGAMSAGEAESDNAAAKLRSGEVVETANFVLFWKPPSTYGQWSPSTFEVDGAVYNCAEQFMMAEKARLFGDHETRGKILAELHPAKQKALGQKVSNFNEALWDKEKFNIVVSGNRAKFTQNPELLQQLLATGDKTLVEASPMDNIWGIGLDATQALACDSKTWPGQNLLGKALMRVRKKLQELQDPVLLSTPGVCFEPIEETMVKHPACCCCAVTVFDPLQQKLSEEVFVFGSYRFQSDEDSGVKPTYLGGLTIFTRHGSKVVLLDSADPETTADPLTEGKENTILGKPAAYLSLPGVYDAIVSRQGQQCQTLRIVCADGTYRSYSVRLDVSQAEPIVKMRPMLCHDIFPSSTGSVLLTHIAETTTNALGVPGEGNSYAGQLLAITDQAGSVHLLGVSQNSAEDPDEGVMHQRSFLAHEDFEVWCCSFRPPKQGGEAYGTPLILATGADDGTLKLWSISAVGEIQEPTLILQTRPSFGRGIPGALPFAGGRDVHGAGVTSVEFVGRNRMLTGSYDEHLRLWDVVGGIDGEESPTLDLALLHKSAKLGDGAYRLCLFNWTRPNSATQLILCAAMRAGFFLFSYDANSVELMQIGHFGAAEEGTENHGEYCSPLAYGASWCRRDTSIHEGRLQLLGARFSAMATLGELQMMD